MLGVRVASWNVESIRAHHDQVLLWIAANDVDVICLQETKCPRDRFPMAAFGHLGYELIIHGGDGGRGGVAIASRLAVSDIDLGIAGAVAPLDEPRSISATVEGLRLHTCYAPNGRKANTAPHRIKLAWFDLFAAWLELDRDEHGQQLLVGDLNIAPLDIDIWEPARYRKRNLTSPPERAAFEQLLADGALVDVVRGAYGDQAVFTWWNRRSDFYETDRGWRLDHVLADPVTAQRVRDLTVDRDERGRPGSTDHAPLLFDLN